MEFEFGFRSLPVLLVLRDAATATNDLTPNEIKVVVALEKAGASLSMIGITMIFIAYWVFKRIRTVPNLFIMFASIANIGASIACLMGYDGIIAGVDTSLCQTQAFLLEMFMQSDPWWSFAMAVNVFLVFFFGANPASFRKHLWVYCVVCFGAPAIPAIVCLLVPTSDGKIYGDATLWCWIDNSWSRLRIFTYYVPIWICIFLSAVIYFAVGYHVFHQRNQLRNLTFSNHGRSKDVSASDVRDSAEKNLTGRPEYYGTATMEVQVTTESLSHWSPPESPTVPPATVNSPRELRTQRSWAGLADEEGSRQEIGPSNESHFETICTSDSPPSSRSMIKTVRDVAGNFIFKLQHLDPIKLAYLRTSFIFAISVLVTWTPSSINRVYSIVYPDRVSFGLNVASAVVLPLQGVWNAVIFFTTSWNTLREEAKQMKARRKMGHLESQDGSRLDTARTEAMRGRFERAQGVHGDEANEFNVIGRSGTTGTVRAMHGLF